MNLSPRKVFTDLMHDLHDLSVLFDANSHVKSLSHLETDVLNSFYQNLSLTFKLGYSIDSLSSTRLHSHLSLLLELSTELLSENIENSTGNHNLEKFLTHVLNIFRLMFKIGFYGNTSKNGNKDISKIRNLLLNSIQIDLSDKQSETKLYRKYILPILFNFIFFTDEWIDKFNRIAPEPFFTVKDHQSTLNDHNVTDGREITNLFFCDNSKSDFDLQNDFSSTMDESDTCQTVLFVPFPLKSIAVRTVRSLLISNLGKDGFYKFHSNSLMPSQLIDDIRFVEQSRASIYCESLSTVLEICPHYVTRVISQQFCIFNDLI